MLGAHRVAWSTARAVSASALLGALAFAAPSALAQGAPQAQPAPVELAPMRVAPSPLVIDVAAPIVIEAAPEHAASEPQRASDGRALVNPFGTEGDEAGSLAEAATGPASARERDAAVADPRCPRGAHSYFDARSQLFRPCAASDAAQPAPARATTPSRAVTVACRPGQRSYFDPREQLFRPCPELASGERSDVRASAPRAAPRAPGARRCAAGVRVYYDERERLYRPCT